MIVAKHRWSIWNNSFEQIASISATKNLRINILKNASLDFLTERKTNAKSDLSIVPTSGNLFTILIKVGLVR